MRSCNKCEWFDRKKANDIQLHFAEITGGKPPVYDEGECKRYPPKWVDNSHHGIFVIVNHDDCCGEFSKRFILPKPEATRTLSKDEEELKKQLYAMAEEREELENADN